jgi:hypothetical protein
VSLTLGKLKKNLAPQGYLFSYVFNVFNLGANKEDLLHVTNCTISLLFFG